MSRWLPVTILAVFVVGSLPADLHAQEGFLRNGVTAHRGNSLRFPENTMPAFRSAIEIGADWIELDIFRTRDGYLVVTHDRNARRVTGHDVDITEATWGELKKLDAATEFRRTRKLTIDQCPREEFPLLEDVLKLVMTQERTRVSIQPKMDCVPDAIEVIRMLGAEKWVGFNDGNLKLMSQVKELAPKIPVFWDRPDNSDLVEDIRVAKSRRFEALVLNLKGVTPEKIQMIKSAGLESGAWTVNDPVVMKQLLSDGIDRIYTDDPAALLELVAKRTE